MTGWRLGYVCAHKVLIDAMKKDTSVCNNVFTNNGSVSLLLRLLKMVMRAFLKWQGNIIEEEEY